MISSAVISSFSAQLIAEKTKRRVKIKGIKKEIKNLLPFDIATK